MNRFIFILLIFCSISFSQIISNVDFENRTEGVYTNDQAKEDFVKKAGASSWYALDKNNGENSRIVYDSLKQGMVLQFKYPAGCVGPNDKETSKACAGQIKQPLTTSAEEMWLSYDILFEKGFEFVLGGKLPGLCGGECYTGGERPSTGDGWSARVMWRKDGKVVQYLYFVEQASTYGDDALWNMNGNIPQKQFIPGTWHKLVTRVKLNTVNTEGKGEKNGIIQSWFDGELALNIDTLRLRDFADQKIDIFYLSTFHGGSTTEWSPQNDVFVRFDNFIVSLDSIPVSPSNENTTTEQPLDSTTIDSTLSINGVKNAIHSNSLKLISGKTYFLKTPLIKNQTFEFYDLNGILLQKKTFPKGTQFISNPNAGKVFILRKVP